MFALVVIASAIPNGAEADPRPPRDWVAQFPEIACRLPHLNERLNSSNAQVRRGAVRSVLWGQPAYTADPDAKSRLARQFLVDPDPEIAWVALESLYNRKILVEPNALPQSVLIPLHGIISPRSERDLARLRSFAGSPPIGPPDPRLVVGREAERGWALKALAAFRDSAVPQLARALTESPNVFNRYTAAVALLESDRPRALGLLREITKTQESFYRWSAAAVLCREGEESALWILRDQLAQANPEEQFRIADTLEELTGFFSADPNEWSRRLRSVPRYGHDR